MGQTAFFKNKFYLALLGSWLGLYIVQMILSFIGVRGTVPVYILAVLYGLSVALMLGVGYVKKEKIFLLLAVVCATIQVVLFLFSIPAMVTGKDILPKTLQCLFHVPGYGLMTGAYGWRWAFAIFWGVIFCGALEGLAKKLGEEISAWWDGRRSKADSHKQE